MFDIQSLIRRNRLGNLNPAMMQQQGNPIGPEPIPPDVIMTLPPEPIQPQQPQSIPVDEIPPLQSHNPRFPAMGPPGQPPTDSPVMEMSDPDYMSAIQQLRRYKPDTTNTDRFNKLLDDTPVREDPSIARRILASGLAMKGGPKAAEEVMYAPHARNMADWTAKTGPYNQAATQERYGNANDRQTLTSLATAEGYDRRYDEQERHNRETEKNARDITEIRRLKDLGYTFTVTDTKIIAHRPDGTIYETGLDPGKFSPFALEEMRQRGRIALAEERGEQARETKAAPGSGDGSSAGNERAEKARRLKLWETDPEAREFMETNGNDFRLKKPPTALGSWGADKVARFKRFQAKLYPDMPSAEPEPEPERTPSRTPSRTQPPPSQPATKEAKPSYKDTLPPSMYNTEGNPNQKNPFPSISAKPQEKSSGRGSIPSLAKKGVEVAKEAFRDKTITQYDAKNKITRQSNDDGKTWMFRVDGSNTWTRTDPRGGSSAPKNR